MLSFVFAPDKCVPASYASHWFDGIRLDQGVNTFDDQTADRLLANPDYDRYVAWGAIMPIETTETVDLEPATGLALSTLSVEAAQLVIAQTHDVATLQAYLADETRKTLRRDINARITQIQSGKE
jgi:hypothetical protein